MAIGRIAVMVAVAFDAIGSARCSCSRLSPRYFIACQSTRVRRQSARFNRFVESHQARIGPGAVREVQGREKGAKLRIDGVAAQRQFDAWPFFPFLMPMA